MVQTVGGALVFKYARQKKFYIIVRILLLPFEDLYRDLNISFKTVGLLDVAPLSGANGW